MVRSPKIDPIKMMAANSHAIALEVGALKPDLTPTDNLASGEIGYIVTNLKSTARSSSWRYCYSAKQ